MEGKEVEESFMIGEDQRLSAVRTGTCPESAEHC
jgi:hypothetical protein